MKKLLCLLGFSVVVHIVSLSSTHAHEYPAYTIEAKITTKTEAYIEIPEAVNLKREIFSKYIYHTPYPNAVPIPYTDTLINMITEKIWGPEKIGTEALALSNQTRIHPEYSNIPVRIIEGGLRMYYSDFEKLIYEHNYMQKKDFDFLLKFYDEHKLYDNVSASHTYTFELPQGANDITVKLFPFSPEDVSLEVLHSPSFYEEPDIPENYFVPKLLLSTPYFDVRNLTIYLNKEKIEYESTQEEYIEEDEEYWTLEEYEHDEMIHGEPTGEKVFEQLPHEEHEETEFVDPEALPGIERKYYLHTYHYKTLSGYEFSIPALLPYYIVTYALTDEDQQKTYHTLDILYDAHTLDSLHSIDNSILRNP